MLLERLRHVLFFVVSGFGFLVESTLLSIGLIVALAFALNGLSATALAFFVNGLADHYLLAPRHAQIEFLAGVAFAVVLVTIFVSCLRAPVHFRRIRDDAETCFNKREAMQAPSDFDASSVNGDHDNLDVVARKVGTP